MLSNNNNYIFLLFIFDNDDESTCLDVRKFQMLNLVVDVKIVQFSKSAASFYDAQ